MFSFFKSNKKNPFTLKISHTRYCVNDVHELALFIANGTNSEPIDTWEVNTDTLNPKDKFYAIKNCLQDYLLALIGHADFIANKQELFNVLKLGDILLTRLQWLSKFNEPELLAFEKKASTQLPKIIAQLLAATHKENPISSPQEQNLASQEQQKINNQIASPCYPRKLAAG